MTVVSLELHVGLGLGLVDVLLRQQLTHSSTNKLYTVAQKCYCLHFKMSKSIGTIPVNGEKVFINNLKTDKLSGRWQRVLADDSAARTEISNEMDV